MTAFYNDSDSFCCAWLSNLMDAGMITPGRIDDRPIQELSATDFVGYRRVHLFAGIGGWDYALTLARWGDAPVWTGSCPCQPFSGAGKGKGAEDPRHLWPEFDRLIRQCRPPVVFGEQVASPAGLQWFDLVSADMENAGYAVGAADLCAAGVGAPHIRQRLFFVADAPISRVRSFYGKSGPSNESQEPPGGFHLSGVMADTLPTGRAEGRAITGDKSATRSGAISSLDDASRLGLQARRLHDAEHDGLQPAAEGRDGFWSNADWLACRDGKARPVESSTFPLAHGIPARVGRLRGYGNAIVAQTAAAFIAAYLEREQ